ncbi:uncharacterized protein Tco_1370172 [Tanacetum coccineum]
MSPGNVAREGIPFELFRSTYPGRHVAQETYPQRQVARDTPDLLLGNMANVVVLIVLIRKGDAGVPQRMPLKGILKTSTNSKASATENPNKGSFVNDDNLPTEYASWTDDGSFPSGDHVRVSYMAGRPSQVIRDSSISLGELPTVVTMNPSSTQEDANIGFSIVISAPTSLPTESIWNAGGDPFKVKDTSVQADVTKEDRVSSQPLDEPIIQDASIRMEPSSYAGVASSNQPTSLKGESSKFNFIKVDNVFEGVELSMPRRVMENVSTRFENTLYGYFIGKRLAFLVVEYFVKNNWAKYGLKRIMLNAKGFFFFKFDSRVCLESVLEGGPWMIRNNPIILNKWTMNTSLLKEELNRVPIWVKFHDVSLEVFDEEGISIIGSHIGKPIMLDAYTSSMCPGFTKEVITIEYEWKPPRKEINYKPKAPNVSSNGGGTRGEESSKDGSYKQSNAGSLVASQNILNDRQRNKDVVDTGAMKMSNISSPNPFAALGVDEDDDEKVENIWDESANLNIPNTRASTPAHTVVNENNLSICAILESHVDVAVVYDTCKKVCHRWKWTSNGSLCPKGSQIILGWNDDIVDVMIMAQTNQVMHVQINIRADNKALFCSFIYADNYYVDRRALWNNLDAHALHMRDKPWVLLGDFNVALNLEGHSCGGYEPNIAMQEFKECVQKIEVMDVNVTGLHFTWNQKPKGSNGILKKIDRIMCNLPFTNDFPVLSLYFSLIGFHDVVESSWSLNVTGCAMYRVVKRLKGLKTPFRKLLHDQGNLHDRVNRLHMELDEAQKAIDCNPSCSLLRDEHARYLMAFKEASLDEERFLRQKSKIEWLNAGDSNTGYFHKIVKSKCARNRIEIVRDSSNVLHEGNAVASAFVLHYEQFLGIEGTTTPLDDHGVFFRVLSDHKVEFMVREVFDSEIKGALFSMGDDKAPGPDGLTVTFFKKSCDIVGGEITIAIMDFFTNGKLLKELNHTIISLIPKVFIPSKINDYRPISCYNILFKFISKIIANLIKGYLGDLVSINQSAFIPGRRILDNILLTQELIRNYHRKRGPPRCAFKVEIQKAYDTVEWGFLRSILVGFGFHSTMVNWIMVCVTTTSYSISINGDIHGWFNGKRGLRQGDPLSPYLFTLVMEVLTLILQRRVQNAEDFQYHHLCKEQRIVNLCFANDIFLFTRGNPNSFRVIMDVLEEFKNVSGLVPSIPKSTALFCNVLNALKANILSSMPFAEGTLPVRYLGVPLISSRLLYRDCKVLIEMLESRVNDWRNKFLSLAGQLQLVRSVLSFTHIYWASVFILPVRIISELEQLVKGFLWCQGEMKKGKAKVAWEVVCLPQREGGLGIRRIEDFNIALMATHICWGWRKLLQIRPHVRPFIWHKINNGRSTSMWFDKWTDPCPLREMLTVRNIVRSNFSLLDMVSDLISNGSWRWPHDWSSRFPNVVNVPVLEINNDLDDKIVWRDGRGVFQCFSVAGAWDSLWLRADVVDWYHVIWFPHCIPRHAIHMLLMIKEMLKTQDRMRQWDVGPSIDLNLLKCPLCDMVLDSHSYLFFKCSFVSQVWFQVRALTGMSSVPPRFVDVLAFLIPSKGSLVSNVISWNVLAATTYCLWNEQNSRLFKKKKSIADQIVQHITSLVRVKLVTFRFKRIIVGSRLLLDQWKIPSSCFDHDGISSDGLFSFAKRSTSAPTCFSKPPDSIKNWADHFFWVDSRVSLISVPLYTGGTLEKDPAPHLTTRQEQAVKLLESHKAPFRRYPECFLCLVGLSPYYPFDENSYPAFEYPDGTGGCYFPLVVVLLRYET